MVSVLVEKFAKDQKEIDEKRTMALINKPNYSLLQSSLKIDDLIDPRMNTVSSILKHVHKVIIPRSNFIFQKDDRVVLLAKKDSISIVENIFRLSSV